MAQLLGGDIGSSGIKASIIEAENNSLVGASLSPSGGEELKIQSPKDKFAEQDPQVWYENFVASAKDALAQPGVIPDAIQAIGIAYQMHGLVLLDKAGEVIRPSIIWCDSRAVEIGQQAFERVGKEWCLENLLNSPGNFTFSKLAWVKQNEPENFDRIHKVMLPGDYIAYRLTGEMRTTIPGLSEGMFWNIKERAVAERLLAEFGISVDLLSDVVPTFGKQGLLTAEAAKELGLRAGIPITYRAGDQPNNALSLKVLNRGEVATTAGTSAVIYGITETAQYDPQSRVNTFVHVNDSNRDPRNGVLLCVNGAGSSYSWIRRTLAGGSMSYQEMDSRAGKSAIGANGVVFLPFGNGSERMLGNRILTSAFYGLTVNKNLDDIFRAELEGVAFAMNYGLQVMRNTGVSPEVIRAGDANMFKSAQFREIFTCVTGATLELYNTDGAQGAARGAGYGAGIYGTLAGAFDGLKLISRIEPDLSKVEAYSMAYNKWLSILEKNID